MAKKSNISGFYKLKLNERLKHIKENCNLTDEEIKSLKKTGTLEFRQVDRMVENAIGTFEIPLGLALNFKINNKDYIIPMATEEPSVIAAASNAAKIARASGGFKATSTDPIMIAQIQLTKISDINKAKNSILNHKKELIRLANDQDPMLVKFGGGAKDLEIRNIKTKEGNMLIIHLLVDVRDAMGANALNTMAEAIAPKIEDITGGKVYLRIISNLADRRLAKAEAIFSKENLGGEDVIDGILSAYYFAEVDHYRATTHNKGIMNGISALVRATGNDTRAIESGAHSFAAKDGKYKPLAKYEKNENGDLVGKIEIPTAIGLIGGATKVHPIAKIAIKILEVKSAKELSEIIACLGLAQNLAALRALSTEGIQRGHMSLHAKNVAAMAGAKGEMIDKIAKKLVEEKKVRIDRAKEILNEIQ